MKITNEVPSLSKFWRNLVTVKIVDIRHLNGHISYINQNKKDIFLQKVTPKCRSTCTKSLALCKVIFIFLCIFPSLLWSTFLLSTPYIRKSLPSFRTVEKHYYQEGKEFCKLRFNFWMRKKRFGPQEIEFLAHLDQKDICQYSKE